MDTSEGPVYLGRDTIEKALTTEAAIGALESVLNSGFDPEQDAPRTRVDTSSGQLLQMPSTLGEYVGSKLLTITPANAGAGRPVIQGLYSLFGGGDQRPLAILDGMALTNLRTAAVSGLGARRLAAPGPKRLVVFGTGAQAWEHIRAFTGLFDLTAVEIVGRTAAHAERLAARVRGLGLEVRVGDAGAVARADIILCCTAAAEPLFDGSLVPDSAAVVAMGSHTPGHRELDDALLGRGTVCVESRASALREAGEVIHGLESGAIHGPDSLVTLADLVLGRTVPDARRPAVFKTTGMPWEDLAVATAVFEAAAADQA
ncbi:ornithine cyclodeaminase family protein [Cryobacterium tagatosivorans]|uniref:Ornithine cyclodeaminase family protein n=1 Tax=Cryobacterium tagatosivorans TaxID=1259199 RepID=A0A4V3I756_9MICO|nr:ornithine cyclodeaminase family protein [Cryobacterium tagatosivorans]TFB49883.1 ornithine cyclodeaminase family protein [Cryobacterium tagatosivorans]